MPKEAKNACCRDDENLKREATDRKDLVIDRCQVCGARHFRLFVDPGVIGLKGAPMGEAPAAPPTPWVARKTTT